MASRQRALPCFKSFTDLAREYIRLIVLVRRYSGVSAKHVIADTAGELGLGKRRTAAIYYGYDERYATGVDETAWMSVREKAAAILLKEAASLRRRAAYLEAKAEQIQAEKPSQFNNGGADAWLSVAGGSE